MSASVSDIQRLLEGLSPSSDECQRLLLGLLTHQDLRRHTRGLREPDLLAFVELIDNALDHIPVTDDLFWKTSHGLQGICSDRGVLPSSYLIPSEKLSKKEVPFAAGAFDDTHEAEFDGKNVYVKVLRSHARDTDSVVNEIFYRGVVLWKRLRHPNITPFLGVPTRSPLPFEVVYDCVEELRITTYVSKHPEVDRTALLRDVADGLHYLHSCRIIHGNLTVANILIDKGGRARLKEFWLSSFSREEGSLDTPRDVGIGCATMWPAPEVLERGATTKEGDIFSFGMVTVETFAGHPPFIKNYPAALYDILNGKHPQRPETLTDDGLWELTQRCWNKDPGSRPIAFELLEFFGRLQQVPVPAWRRLIDHSLPADQRISLINAIFSDGRETEAVKSLCGKEAQSIVDVMDKTLEMLVPQLYNKCLDTLRKVCGCQGLLPGSVQIPLCYNRLDAPLYRGGYADVWKGQYDGRDVAVKVLSVDSTSDFKKITSRFCKEVVAWKTLRHPNVLPLLGVTMNKLLSLLAMASEWMANGNINQFIKVNENVDRFELLKDVANGLIYLHDQAMIHGDLKGANILIDDTCRARIADFGLLTFISDSENPTASSSIVGSGTTRWMGPEILHPEKFGFGDGRHSKESDCYALGMVILEVLTGRSPFAGHSEVDVMQKMTSGKHPERPKEQWSTDDLWKTLKQCWSSRPKRRPTVEAVLECLGRVSMALQFPSSNTTKAFGWTSIVGRVPR